MSDLFNSKYPPPCWLLNNIDLFSFINSLSNNDWINNPEELSIKKLFLLFFKINLKSLRTIKLFISFILKLLLFSLIRNEIFLFLKILKIVVSSPSEIISLISNLIDDLLDIFLKVIFLEIFL